MGLSSRTIRPGSTKTVQVVKAHLQRLDIRIEFGLPQRNLLGADRLALLAEAPALEAGKLELELLGERRGLLEFLQPRGQFPIARIEQLFLLGNRALMFCDSLIALAKGFVLRLQLTEQRRRQRFQSIGIRRQALQVHAAIIA